MPVDIVKVLKTQDENYIRTMRGSNAKVRLPHPQHLRANEYLKSSHPPRKSTE